MSVAMPAPAVRPIAHGLSRPVIAAPNLAVVPSPAPRRGFAATVALCVLFFVGALLLSFYLNTRMVQGAYEIKAIKVELSTVQIHEASLAAQAAALTAPGVLQEKVAALGMVPASSVQLLPLGTAPEQND